MNKKRNSFVSRQATNKNYGNNTPTPLDFDVFIPWICAIFENSNTVVVTKCNQEDYVRQDSRRGSVTRSKSNKNFKYKNDDSESDNVTTMNKKPCTVVSKKEIERGHVVPITAYYDSKGYLVEISIQSCSFKISRKVIQAINMCLPFHSFLTKLSICKGGLSYLTLYDISKLLPVSNLTDICLDGSPVSEGNYFILLDHTSKLKNLSLSRCNINDVVCKEIAVRIDIGRPVTKCLQILDLSSNSITDVGVKFIGDILRRNRHLLHLDLSGNKITDEGAASILNHLLQFPLTYDEIVKKKSRKLEYLERKQSFYRKCLEEVAVHRQKVDLSTSTQSNKKTSPKQQKVLYKKNETNTPPSSTNKVKAQSAVDFAEIMTLEIVGEFIDPFNTDNTILKNDYLYSIGNLTLCSLNLAYNNLEIASVWKIHEILKYQSQLVKPPRCTGLLRIVLDGNYIPKTCEELNNISVFLRNVVIENAPVSAHVRRRSSGSKKI